MHDSGSIAPPMPDASQDAGHDAALPVSEQLHGCHPDRLAIALAPGGRVVNTGSADAPYTCATTTGKEGPFNSSIAVTQSGAVLFAPALGAGVMGSWDGGATWKGPLNHPPTPSTDWGHPFLWRDVDTDRLFFTVYDSLAGPCAGGTGHNYWISTDHGKSWQEIKGGVGCGSYDWGKILTGPPAKAATKATLQKNGYPNVVYFCAGGPTYALGPNHFCYRSLDGGKTFTRTKADSIDPLRGQVGWPNAGAVAPDGTIYQAHTSSGGVALTTSEDEGDSWHDIVVPGSHFNRSSGPNFLSSNVATDSAGNIYVVWVDDSDFLPYLAFSRDKGKTWSKPWMVASPEVRIGTCVNVAVKEPGYVAIDYYGSSQQNGNGGDGYSSNDGRPYDAYLTVSTNVFAAAPLFWSTTINEPGDPAILGIDLLTSEYIGAPAFGPDGSIWAGFLKYDTAKKLREGFAGRMIMPHL